MRWFSCPAGDAIRLRKDPVVDQWEKASHPAKIRLEEYLDDTEELLSGARIQGQWALRLDVGRPAEKSLLDKSDLDNYAKPLARRLGNADLVSVWCTKSHSEASFVRLEEARASEAPTPDFVIAAPTAGCTRPDHLYHHQIDQAIAVLAPLPPDRAVRMELAFVVPSTWTWWNYPEDVVFLDVTASEEDPHDLARVLNDLLESRTTLFRDAKVPDIGHYRAAGNHMSDTVVVLDDENLWEPWEGASRAVARVARTGRSAGIHLITVLTDSPSPNESTAYRLVGTVVRLGGEPGHGVVERHGVDVPGPVKFRVLFQPGPPE